MRRPDDGRGQGEKLVISGGEEPKVADDTCVLTLFRRPTFVARRYFLIELVDSLEELVTVCQGKCVAGTDENAIYRPKHWRNRSASVRRADQDAHLLGGSAYLPKIPKSPRVR